MTAISNFVNALSDAQKGLAAACSLVLFGGTFASVVILTLSGFVNAPKVAEEALTEAKAVGARVDTLVVDLNEHLSLISRLLCQMENIPARDCVIEKVGR